MEGLLPHSGKRDVEGAIPYAAGVNPRPKPPLPKGRCIERSEMTEGLLPHSGKRTVWDVAKRR